MTALRTYAAELAAVAAVLRDRKAEAREWARPDRWSLLRIKHGMGDGYWVKGECVVGDVHIGGVFEAACMCGGVWQSTPCEHQLGLASLWVGGHPIRFTFGADAVHALELEGGAL